MIVFKSSFHEPQNDLEIKDLIKNSLLFMDKQMQKNREIFELP